MQTWGSDLTVHAGTEGRHREEERHTVQDPGLTWTGGGEIKWSLDGHLTAGNVTMKLKHTFRPNQSTQCSTKALSQYKPFIITLCNQVCAYKTDAVY